jgi:hypothetical protein
MTALVDLSDVVNRATGGSSGAPELVNFYKDSRALGIGAFTAAGRMSSLWSYAGSPGHGDIPGAVSAPDNTTDGSLKQTDPAGGREKWLLGGAVGSLVAGVLVLYDRLLHVSSLNGTVTSAQAVGGTLTRYTNGIGNAMFAEVHTQIGATSTTLTAAYVDQAGSASTSTPTAIGNTGLREVQRMIWLPLASGDNGVRGITSVTLAGTTGTAGDFGVVVAHPLAYLPIGGAGTGILRDFISGTPGPVEIQSGACLAWGWLASVNAGPQLYGALQFVES